MTKTVVFICMGNSCRSPIAEGLFRKKVEERGLDFTTFSRGIRAANGGGPALHGVNVMLSKYGIDTSAHRRATLTMDDIQCADVLVPLDDQINAFLRSQEHCADKIVFCKSIDDPYGNDIQIYESCAAEIESMVDEVIEQLQKQQP